MVSLREVTGRVWDFISPRKTQKRRDKPFKAPAPVRPRATSSPAADTKVAQWKDQIATSSSSHAADTVMLPPSPPMSAQPAPSVEPATEFESDDVIRPSVEESPIDGAVDNAWDANEDTVLADDSEFLEQRKRTDAQRGRVRQEVQGRELREAGWPEDAVFLFQKLNMRGFEPLMPQGWAKDFESLPWDLFTLNDNIAFIKPDKGSDFRAQHALEELFTVGGLARDAISTKAPIRTPEFHIGAAIQKYNRWALKDVEIDRTWKNISLFRVVVSNMNTAPAVSEHKMLKKLGKLHALWRDALYTHAMNTATGSPAPEDPPTIYGVIASYTVMAFVSYVPPTQSKNGTPTLRTIAIFNFDQEGYDVWNSLAIAIFVIHCRNRMKQLRVFLPEPLPVIEEDPDL
ncbi:hypothetical protein DM02DRAFT_612132 [Periconia macrospinosa]|uniref:Uncharacterized protein n=1 Tax=Periconia macrospinosa TaxID=97972 RepID=A0A2V1DZ66_9PLEO|nr:hypothetical protein DM02DRAFT_612132 [Periconia macrospinosa]